MINIEQKDEISFNEFKFWLSGLIRGKNGAIPDVADWKVIKTMMDKVVENDKPHTQPTVPIISDPYTPAGINPHGTSLTPTWFNPYGTWCETSSLPDFIDNLDFGDLNITIPKLEDPHVGNIKALTDVLVNTTLADIDKRRTDIKLMPETK